MTNTFTSIQPVLFEAAQIVSQEPIGFLDAIDLNFNNEKPVALGDTVYVPYAGVGAVSSFSPAATAPEGTASTASSVGVTIQDIAQVSWNMTGEQILSLENASMNMEWLRQKVAQGMRALRNTAEAAAGVALKEGASRAVGTAGTNPFNASTLANITAARKELMINGAPKSDLHLVMDLTASEALLNLGVVQNFYQAGSSAQLEKGVFLDKMGFKMHESGNVALHTKGTGTGYDVTSAGAAVKATTIPMEGGNSGTILAGDVVTFASGATDANPYVISSGSTASGAAAGNIIIGRPGLRVLKADADEMTIGNNYRANLAFHRNACVGIIRQPQMPSNPTIATTVITDEFGCTYLLCDVAQWGQRSWVLIMAYGFKVVQQEHVVIMMG
jgi:hypothetical protein